MDFKPVVVTTNTKCAGNCGQVLAPPHNVHGFQNEEGAVFCATCVNPNPEIPNRVPYLGRPADETQPEISQRVQALESALDKLEEQYDAWIDRIDVSVKALAKSTVGDSALLAEKYSELSAKVDDLIARISATAAPATEVPVDDAAGAEDQPK